MPPPIESPPRKCRDCEHAAAHGRSRCLVCIEARRCREADDMRREIESIRADLERLAKMACAVDARPDAPHERTPCFFVGYAELALCGMVYRLSAIVRNEAL
jgi:hypothetical protein